MRLPCKGRALTATIAAGGSTPASNSPWSTPTWAAPRAPPPPSTHVRRAGPKIVSSLPPSGGGSPGGCVGSRLRRARRLQGGVVPPQKSGAWMRWPSRAFFPRIEVALLLRGQGVDRDPHRMQLELCDLFVYLRGYSLHPP